jgi:integrase/recombinase XerC
VRQKLSRLKPADVIEKLGLDLMHRAEAETGLSPFKRSLMFRDGLAIALLIRRPLRLRNFANMKMHTHLVGERFTRITFSAAEMKGKRPFEAAFPANLQNALHRYLKAYRPHLLSYDQEGSPGVDMALWISSEGRAVDPGAFSKAIAKRTRAAFGRDLTPHLFRDASVTTLIRDAPASALLTKTILGHSSIDVTFNHYNQAQMVESSRRYAEVMADLQQKGQGAD